MKSFIFSPDEARRQARNRALPTIIVLAFAALALPASSYIVNPGIAFSDFLSGLLMVVAIAGIFGFISVRSTAKSAASLRITIGSDFVRRTRQGSKDVTIHRAEIRKLVEAPGQGLWVESGVSDSIFIPKELTGFEEIKTLLSQWSPPQIEANRAFRMLLIFLVALVLTGVLIINPSTRNYGFGLYALGFVVSLVLAATQSLRKFIARRQSNRRSM